ncbi:MAG: ABC transporter permease [[Clostridium] fimetarium]|nr:ABC transporter permease [Alistipes timonensis]MCM1406634.1 ABC transporter permease [[Clostridium] fimetarium]
MKAIIEVARRELRRLTSRPIYLVGMLLVPLFMAFFFLSLLGEGLPRKVPVAIVDLDHSQISRRITRQLNATELCDITCEKESYNHAMDAVQRGEIYGFFVIPSDFERKALAGRAPTLTFYSNLTYYVPGTLIYKGFKTLAVTTSGQLVQQDLVSKGASNRAAGLILQPMVLDNHPMGNPYLNYSYYLSTSFLPGVLQLMIFLMTVFSITQEIKTGSSTRWLAEARGRIGTALLGKLLPQTVIFLILGLGINALMFDFHHFPHNCPMWHMALAMLLFVVACQSFGVFVCSVIPNPRLALSVASLIGILAFSVAAFSYPVQAMYGAIAIFANILPVRWYFLIYIDQALNGIPLYYSRLYYAALLVFPIVATLGAPLLKRALRKPVYVP